MKNVLTPKFRVSYPSVFKKKFNKLKNKEEYGLVALFPKGADLSTLNEAVKQAIIEEWGADPKKHPKDIRMPFRDQDDREKENDQGQLTMPAGYEKGAIYLNLNSKDKPGLINQKKEEIIDETEFYGGCWARATIRPFAYGGPGTGFKPGVTFYLQNIQKLGDGEPFSGRTTAEEDFEAVVDPAESTAPKSADELFN